MKQLRNWLVALTVLVLATGCGSSSSSSDSSPGTTSVRVANITAVGNLTVAGTYTSSSSSSTSTASATIGSGVASGAASAYTSLTAATYAIQASVADGSLSASPSQSAGFAKDTNYTVVAYQRAGGSQTTNAMGTLVLTDNQTAPSAGFALLSVYNTASDAGSLDVYLVPHGANVANYSPTFTSVASTASSLNQSINAGTYDIVVTSTGKPGDVRLTIPSLTLASTELATLILTGTTGGALVNGALIDQGGAIKVMQQSDKARVRVVGGFGNDGSLVNTTLSGNVSLNALTSPSVGSYALVPANSTIASMSITPHGGTTTAISSVPTTVFVGGGDYTVLVSGTAVAPVVSVLTDNNQAPTSSALAKIRLVNAAVATTSGGLSLTDNYQQVVSNLGYGLASDYSSATAGASLLTISSPLATFPTYTIQDSATSSGIPYITSGTVYTIFVLQAGSTVTTPATPSIISLIKDR